MLSWLCFAGDLSSDESCRRLVPDAVWQRLKYYFPVASEFTSAHSICWLCQVNSSLIFAADFRVVTQRCPALRGGKCCVTTQITAEKETRYDPESLPSP